ncbi:MAG: DUF1365 domain-containing protein [Planctomycetota bacterium]|nr:DUF1365 domain-containing protein [Planctomycetota bacterium]
MSGFRTPCRSSSEIARTGYIGASFAAARTPDDFRHTPGTGPVPWRKMAFPLEGGPPGPPGSAWVAVWQDSAAAGNRAASGIRGVRSSVAPDHHSPVMNSCLYECHVMHARFSPRAHRFVYRIFLLAIDLDELAALPRHLALFSCNRPNVYSFCERDFLPVGETLHHPSRPMPATPPFPATSLKDRVIAHAARHGVDLAGGRIVLVSLPRVFGYLFNPVSFYFCYDRQGAPAAAIAEVTNTFREVKPFFLGGDTQAARRGEFRLRVPKHFYVSPFSDVDVAFDFTLRAPGERLSIQIDDYVGPARTLTSTLTGPRRELTSVRLAWFTLKYPLLTLRVITLIHWHAFRLWWKRLPWFAKAARPADQRDLYRPHGSLKPRPATP